MVRFTGILTRGPVGRFQRLMDLNQQRPVTFKANQKCGTAQVVARTDNGAFYVNLASRVNDSSGSLIITQYYQLRHSDIAFWDRFLGGTSLPYYVTSLLKVLLQPNTSAFNVIRFFPKSLRKKGLW